MSANPHPAEAARILVAEDEFLVFLVLEEELRAKGYMVIGPFGTLQATREALARERVDLVLLDINMGGSMAWPIADDLMSENIPFIFLSGYADALPERFRGVPRFAKPYDPELLMGDIHRRLGR